MLLYCYIIGYLLTLPPTVDFTLVVISGGRGHFEDIHQSFLYTFAWLGACFVGKGHYCIFRLMDHTLDNSTLHTRIVVISLILFIL